LEKAAAPICDVPYARQQTPLLEAVRIDPARDVDHGWTRSQQFRASPLSPRISGNLVLRHQAKKEGEIAPSVEKRSI
jgi:hypothetical protein